MAVQEPSTKDFTAGKITKEVLNEKYRELISKGADIIEADLAIEAGLAVASLQKVKSTKKAYFKIIK